MEKMCIFIISIVYITARGILKHYVREHYRASYLVSPARLSSAFFGETLHDWLFKTIFFPTDYVVWYNGPIGHTDNDGASDCLSIKKTETQTDI